MAREQLGTTPSSPKDAATKGSVETALGGVPTTTGKALINAADAAAARTAIGAGTSSLALGTTSSTAKAGDYQPSSANISDSTATGRAVLTAANTIAAKAAINADFYVNVKDYGAVGDGVADDTAAVHAARDAAGVGGVVYFPPGDYKVGALSASVAGQTWQLDGATLVYAGPTAPTGGIPGVAAASGITIQVPDVTIAGGTLDMSSAPTNEDTWAGHGIFIWPSDELHPADGANIRDMTIINAPTHGVYALNVERLTVTGCTIRNPGWYGVMTQNSPIANDPLHRPALSDFLIADNTIILDQHRSKETAGVYVRGENNTYYERVRISRNSIKWPFGPGLSGAGNSVFGGSAGVAIWRAKDSVVEGNTMVGGWCGITAPYMTRTVFSNNTCFGFYGIGIEINGNQIGTTVVGNTIDGDSRGAAVEGSHNGIQTSGDPNNPSAIVFKDVSIVGNSIRNLTLTEGVSDGGIGLFLGTFQNVEGLTVSGNVMRAGPGADTFAGIVTACPTANVTISGNNIDGSSRLNSRGVLLQGKAHTGMSITGNNFANCAQAAFLPAVLTDGVFSDIRFTGNLVRNCGASIGGDGAVVATRLTLDTAPTVTSTVTAAGTTILTSSSTETQIFTGSTTQFVRLPSVNVVVGQRFTIINSSTGVVTVTSSNQAVSQTLPAGTSATFVATVATPTAPAHWLATGSVTLTGTETFLNKTLTNPRIASVRDSNGAPYVSTNSTEIIYISPAGKEGLQVFSSATVANFIRITSAPQNNNPILEARGTDTNIDLALNTKGTGVVRANNVPVTTNSTTSVHTAQQIELGHASDTTLTRVSAGVIAVEGNTVATRLTNTATLDFGSVTAQSFADLTITVTGAATGDAVALGTPTAAVTAGIAYTAWVSATDTVTVRAHNYTAGPLDPASGTFRATIIR